MDKEGAARAVYLEAFLQRLCMFLADHWYEMQLDHFEDEDIIEEVRDFIAAS
jgi:hypothetical protein